MMDTQSTDAKFKTARGSIPSQHIQVPFEDYYGIEQSLIEFCDVFDQHSCGRLPREDFKRYCYQYLSEDVVFEMRGLPKKSDRWRFEGIDAVWNKWMKQLFSYQKDAFHLGQPMQILLFEPKKEALVRLRMVYWYTTKRDNLLKCVSEDIVWGLRWYNEQKLWRITYLETTAGLQNLSGFNNLNKWAKKKKAKL